MGVIKDGTVSGKFPATEAFAVHFPAYPSSISRAIEVLGGTEAILKARCTRPHGKLELRFRPEDPCSHPAFGRLRSSTSLLLKISKNRGDAQLQIDSSAHDEQAQVHAPGEGEERFELCADIVARVEEAYHFDGMVDYQHVLPVHAEAARRKKRNWAEVEEPNFENSGLLDMDQEDLLMLVPPLFSPKDRPEEIVLSKPPLAPNLKKKQEEVAQQPGEDVRKKRVSELFGTQKMQTDDNNSESFEMDIESGLAIDYNVKEIPKQVNLEQCICADEWELHMALSKLFDERPIWPKISLLQRLHDEGLKFGYRMFKRLLFINAYYFSNGPFLRLWIKRGYDPRKHPDSCIYQRIDFRLPQQICDANAANEVKHRWKDICAFRIFPYKQLSLQLFELVDDYIQQEIRKAPKQAECSFAAGWFSTQVLDCLRKRIKMRFMAVYPATGAENLVKIASDRFEKSRRMCIHKVASKAVEQEQQEVIKEHINNNEDKEEQKNVDEDEADEIDDEAYETEIDEGEDELDEYEPLGLDAEISLQSQSYLDTDNISRTYLQDLFGSFPSTEAAGDKTQDADSSDGEYQIYEQDSDGNYDDDL